MAEIQISTMVGQCLNRRIPDRKVLQREIDVWQSRRNSECVRVDWHFTTNDVGIKLKSLYLSIQM